MSAVWWEKTVEYAFVVAAFHYKKCDLASPLAGKHEKLGGDAVFAQASSFVLIEFKRSEAEIPTDESRFIDYEDAKSKLQEYGHHHFVFGVESDKHPGCFDLAAETYFGRTRHQSPFDCLKTGVAETEFRFYLERLSELKKEDGRSSSGHVSPEAISTVLGVSEGGKIVSAQSLYEYSPDLCPVSRPGHASESESFRP